MPNQKLDYNDSLLIDSAKAAVLIATPNSSRILLWTVAVFFIAVIVWASVTSLQQITVAQGRVIPSSNIQKIQNLEGGILQLLLVKEGQNVDAGQALLHLDQTRFAAELLQHQQQSISLMLNSARITSMLNWLENYQNESLTELEYQSFEKFDQSTDQMKHLVFRERQNLTSQVLTVKTQLDGFRSQIAQKAQDIIELEIRITHLKKDYQLGLEEFNLTEPLVAQGAISQVELIKLKRQVLSAQQAFESNQLLLPKTKLALGEAKSKLDSFVAKTLSDYNSELSEKDKAYYQSEQAIISLDDRLKRTTLYAPVNGTIKTIHINTVGGVIMPGADLVEIVPSEDNLLIEAHVSPRDIGFLQLGLNAVVRFSAFDFAIYGSLSGTLEHISADTTIDEQGNHHYKVKIRTDKNYLGTDAKPLKIIPGMAATVDVITGKKTILNYLLKPILRAKQRALRER